MSFAVLSAAVMLYVAVKLIVAVWTTLLVIAIVIASLYALFLVCRLVRRRRAGW